jgi:hypothetical protein
MRRFVTALLTLGLLVLLATLATTSTASAATRPPAATTTTTATTATVAAAAVAVPIRPCVKLRALPGYDYRNQGAVVFEPTGKARYRELLADHVHGAQLQNACRAMINQQAQLMRPCVILRALPGYTYRYQGATITEPSGKARYQELLADHVHGAQLQTACRAMINQQASHGAVPWWVNILRNARRA